MSAAPHPADERTDAVRSADQKRWLEAVFDLLPLPSLLLEPGTGRILFSNREAKKVLAPLPVAESGVWALDRLTDHAGNDIPAERLPWQRAARRKPRWAGGQLGHA